MVTVNFSNLFNFVDTLQTFIMLIGGVVLTFVSLRQVGGYSMLMQLYANSTATISFNSSEDYSARLKCAQPAEVRGLLQACRCRICCR